MSVRNIIDGAFSFGASAFTLAITGGPAWFTHLAVQEQIAPTWAYGFVIGLVGIGLILAFAFIRKGIAGVSPSRSRRR